MPDPTPPRPCPDCGAPVPRDAPAGACPRCLMALGFQTGPGGAALEVVPEEVERRFPGYEILGALGRGGMGVVFRARQKALDREVALKVLPALPGRDPEFAERFRREARALARLQHAGIVQVFDAEVSGDGWCALAMELVDGTNLRRVLAERRLSPKEALGIVPLICDALQYAHDQGVVHRDVKPENVLLAKDGRVKIADFGIAKLAWPEGAAAPLTRSGHVMGTPHYMAPEQVERPADVDHRADIYSLGVVFYEMLTGELPLGRFPPPSERSDVDARIDAIVLRTLEKERDARYQHVAEVKTEVGAAGSAPAPAPQPSAPDAPPSRVSRLAVLTAFSPVVVILVAVAVWGAKSGATSETRLWYAGMCTGTVAVALFVVSLVAWSRVRRSRGLTHGSQFAVLGALGALLAPIVLAPLHERDRVLAEYAAGRRFVSLDSYGTDPTRLGAETADPDVDMIRALVDRYVAIDPAERDAVLALYDERDRGIVESLPDATRDIRADAGLLGLPLATERWIGDSPRLFRLTSITFDGGRALMCVRTEKAGVTAGARRRIDPATGAVDWRFTCDPASREHYGGPAPTLPRPRATPASEWDLTTIEAEIRERRAAIETLLNIRKLRETHPDVVADRRALALLEERRDELLAGRAGRTDPAVLAALESEIARAEERLDDLTIVKAFTEDHPEVVAARRALERLVARRDALTPQSAPPGEDGAKDPK